MQFHFGAALAFVVVACVFLGVTLFVGKVLRPHTPNPAKGAVYECGETALGTGWFNFNPRFYISGLVFLVFDVEVAFTYPVATAYGHWLSVGDGAVAFGEIAAFVAMLFLGLMYVWRRGDLEWVKPRPAGNQEDVAAWTPNQSSQP